MATTEDRTVAVAEVLADWRERGTEIAQPLFSMMKTAGSLNCPAKVSASCRSPFEDVPSPQYVSATPPFFLSFSAQARPMTCVRCVPTGIENIMSREPSGK